MDNKNRVTSYKRGNKRLLDKNFEPKSIKKRNKTSFQ